MPEPNATPKQLQANTLSTTRSSDSPAAVKVIRIAATIIQLSKLPFESFSGLFSMRVLLTVLLCILSPFSYASANKSASMPLIDKVLVVKAERKLHLLHRGEVVKSYRVSLGKRPGAKQYEGDLRTPEGLYWINWRQKSDSYNLAMHISYPNAKDLKRSEELGLPPGSMIMLHGTPNDEDFPEWFFNTLDWTEGCIALNNTDMREVWELVKDGTLIEIRP